MALNFFEKQYYLFKKKEDYFIKSYRKTKGVLELQNGITMSKTPSTKPIKQDTKQQERQLIKGSLLVLKSMAIPFLPHYLHQT